MNNQLNKLKKIKQAVIKKAEARDKIALSRSDEWYESEKGKRYEAATTTLADINDLLDRTITHVETYIEQTS